MDHIEIRSPAFNDRDSVPPRYAHDHDNVSPPLQWTGVPAEASELVLLCEDPDAPSGTFLHWLVTGIDPSADGIGEGEKVAGARVWANGFGEPGWGGPQPPKGGGPHRYIFSLYALDHPAQLPARPSAGDVRAVLDREALASGSLVGTYQR